MRHMSETKLQGTQKNTKLREAQLVEQLKIIRKNILWQQVSRFSGYEPKSWVENIPDSTSDWMPSIWHKKRKVLLLSKTETKLTVCPEGKCLQENTKEYRIWSCLRDNWERKNMIEIEFEGRIWWEKKQEHKCRDLIDSLWILLETQRIVDCQNSSWQFNFGLLIKRHRHSWLQKTVWLFAKFELTVLIGLLIH
jgi:hypothetical protein